MNNILMNFEKVQQGHDDFWMRRLTRRILKLKAERENN
jgi:hypothetical protein